MNNNNRPTSVRFVPDGSLVELQGINRQIPSAPTITAVASFRHHHHHHHHQGLTDADIDENFDLNLLDRRGADESRTADDLAELPPAYDQLTDINRSAAAVASAKHARRQTAITPAVSIDQLNLLVQNHFISEPFQNKINYLARQRVVLLLDDTKTMISKSKSIARTSKNSTKWDELQRFTTVAIELANLVSVENRENGTDIYFLNRETATGCRVPADLNRTFSRKPASKDKQRVLKDKLASILTENKEFIMEPTNSLILVIVLGGKPDDHNDDESELEKFLMSREPNVFTSLVLFADHGIFSRKFFKSAKKWNKVYPRIEVLYNYDYELIRTRLKQKSGGNNGDENDDDHRLSKSTTMKINSYGDYVVKALVDSLTKNKIDATVSFDCCTIL